jgi:hypothetical protein
LHDATLLRVLDEWVTVLSPEHFTASLPLLRRTFSTFEVPERRQIGLRIARGAITRQVIPTATTAAEDFDAARADASLPLIARWLGLKTEDGL